MPLSLGEIRRAGFGAWYVSALEKKARRFRDIGNSYLVN